MIDPSLAPGRTFMRSTLRLPGRRSAMSNARRLALLAVVAGMVATTGATVVLDVLLADQDGSGVPVHMESPDKDCPWAHNHGFCQTARSLSAVLPAPNGTLEASPAPTRLVSLPSASERGPSRLAFLTDCVVPRGPPLV